MLRCMVLPLARRAPSPSMGEGWGESGATRHLRLYPSPFPPCDLSKLKIAAESPLRKGRGEMHHAPYINSSFFKRERMAPGFRPWAAAMEATLSPAW